MMAARPGPEQPTIRGPASASAAAICRSLGSIPKIRRLFIRPASFAGNQPMAAKHGTGWRGAPGGDDYQNVWINPNNPDIILLGSDQGAIVTVNGGKYLEFLVQPVDRAALSRQRRQRLSLPALQRAAGERFGRNRQPRQRRRDHLSRLAAGGCRGIRLRRGRSARSGHHLWRQTNQVRSTHRPGQKILPVPVQTADFRMIRTEPVVFSPIDPHFLFFAGNTLWQTLDRGDHWEKISPDLSRPTFALPPSVGKYREEASAQSKRRGVIYTVAPSPLEPIESGAEPMTA